MHFLKNKKDVPYPHINCKVLCFLVHQFLLVLVLLFSPTKQINYKRGELNKEKSFFLNNNYV